eukprot:767367-Pyramimonas_sp.AAC.1
MRCERSALQSFAISGRSVSADSPCIKSQTFPRSTEARVVEAHSESVVVKAETRESSCDSLNA